MLTLICGLPNAGKTTYSRQYKNAFHQDELGTTNNIVKTVSQINGDAVIEGYFGTRKERSEVISAYKGNVKCIFIDISVEESIRRENRNRHENILRNAFRFFEPPTLDEGWDEIIRIENNGE